MLQLFHHNQPTIHLLQLLHPNNSSSAISESVAPSSYGNSTIAQPSTSTKSDAASITGPITTDKVITNESGIVFTSTVIITHVSEYCDQTSAAAVQSSACEEQSSAKSEQASASSEQVKVITSVVWCESSIQSIESVKTSAEAAHKTEVIASCASELSSLSSAKSEAMKTVSSLVEVQNLQLPNKPRWLLYNHLLLLYS